MFSLPGTQRGEALCNSPLAQHCTEEEEDGSSSSDVTSALRLPSWSQTLLSARRSSSHKVMFVSSLKSVGVLDSKKLHFHLNTKEMSYFSFWHFMLMFSFVLESPTFHLIEPGKKFWWDFKNWISRNTFTERRTNQKPEPIQFHCDMWKEHNYVNLSPLLLCCVHTKLKLLARVWRAVEEERLTSM